MQYLSKQKTLFFAITFFLLLSFPTFAAAQGGTAQVGVMQPSEIPLGGSLQLPVSVENVQELYALDITMKFDPAIVQVEDADPGNPGTQIALGEFLDPGLLLFNVADNEAGTIRFAMSQYNPSEGKSGKGVVLVITFTGKAEGETELSVTEIVLSDKNGVEIPAEGVDATLVISAGAATQAATYPVVEATGMIVLSTHTPTPVPTKTPIPTVAPTKSAEIVPTTTPIVVEDGTVSSERSGYFLANNWWIVLILLVVVIAVGVYSFVIKKKLK